MCHGDAAYPVYVGRAGRTAQFWANDTGTVTVIVYGGPGMVLDLITDCTDARAAYATITKYLGTAVTVRS